MPSGDASLEITEEQVLLLARVAALRLDPDRLHMLADALRNDLRLLDTLRGIDAGTFALASIQQPPEDHHAGR